MTFFEISSTTSCDLLPTVTSSNNFSGLPLLLMLWVIFGIQLCAWRLTCIHSFVLRWNSPESCLQLDVRLLSETPWKELCGTSSLISHKHNNISACPFKNHINCNIVRLVVSESYWPDYYSYHSLEDSKPSFHHSLSESVSLPRDNKMVSLRMLTKSVVFCMHTSHGCASFLISGSSNL